MPQRRQIVHIHIPKCGGTAVTRYLRRLLGPENVAHFGHRGQTAQFRSLPPEALAGFLAVGGHVSYQALLEKLGPSPKYFAIVREPLDLFESYYRDVARRNTHPLHSQAASMPPVEFVELVSLKGFLRPQIFFLSREGSLEEARGFIRSGAIRAEPLQRMRRLMTEIARDFDLSPVVLKRANSSQKFDIKDRKLVREAIAHYFAGDIALYRCVLEKSHELAQGAGAEAEIED